MMPNRLDRGLMIRGWEHQAFAPGQQIEGELADKQIGPVGVELLRGQLLQAKAAFMLLTQLLQI